MAFLEYPIVEIDRLEKTHHTINRLLSILSSPLLYNGVMY